MVCPKFRVWTGEEMVYPNTDTRLVFDSGGWWELRRIPPSESWDDIGEVLADASMEESEVMPCIGRSDQNGRLIYEMDIIETVYDDRFFVIYDSRTHKFEISGADLTWRDVDISCPEVKGNIFENTL